MDLAFNSVQKQGLCHLNLSGMVANQQFEEKCKENQPQSDVCRDWETTIKLSPAARILKTLFLKCFQNRRQKDVNRILSIFSQTVNKYFLTPEGWVLKDSLSKFSLFRRWKAIVFHSTFNNAKRMMSEDIPVDIVKVMYANFTRLTKYWKLFHGLLRL